MVQRVDSVKAEQESQDLLLARPEAREMGLGPGGIDRQDGQVLGRGRRICEPLDKRSRTVVIVSIQRDHGERVLSPLASLRQGPAHVHGQCRGDGSPRRQNAGIPIGCAPRRPPAKPAHRPLHDGPQVAGEAGAPRRVEPLNGDHHGEGADLDPVLDRYVPRRDPAGERHDKAPHALDQRVPGPEPTLAGRSGRPEAGPVDHPIQLPDEPGRAERQGGEVGDARCHRWRARVLRASHTVVPGTKTCSESSGPRRPEQEAPADGRRDLPAVDPRIPVPKTRLLDARDACGRLHQCRARLGQLGDQ
jgi:hypothetical protein